jgi:hypothetical protein
MNKIVARFQDGRVLKGHSEDFLPAKGRFHLTPVGAAPEARPIDVSLADLKAVFFVRDFEGDKSHVDLRIFDPSQRVVGRKLRILFNDGELMVGLTNAYQPGRAGFFIVPADTTSNTERAYIVTAATREVTIL